MVSFLFFKYTMIRPTSEIPVSLIVSVFVKALACPGGNRQTCLLQFRSRSGLVPALSLSWLWRVISKTFQASHLRMRCDGFQGGFVITPYNIARGTTRRQGCTPGIWPAAIFGFQGAISKLTPQYTPCFAWSRWHGASRKLRRTAACPTWGKFQ